MARTIDLSVNLVHSAQHSSGPLRTLEGAALTVLEQRYKMFLALVQAHPERVLAPTGDIDAMWHLHMLHPRAYARDCMAMFGAIVDHDPAFGNPAAGAAGVAALDAHFAATAALWERAFGTPYVLASLDAPAAAAAPAPGATYCVKTGASYCVKTGASYCVKAGAVASM